MGSENELCDTCKRCHESGLEANEHCEYYGEPDGCNHPKGGFMASENETVEDIVSEIKERASGVNVRCDGLVEDVSQDEVWDACDRIEAAHRREKAELRECLKEALLQKCTCNPNFKCKDCAYEKEYCAKWRKAIEATKGAEDAKQRV